MARNNVGALMVNSWKSLCPCLSESISSVCRQYCLYMSDLLYVIGSVTVYLSRLVGLSFGRLDRWFEDWLVVRSHHNFPNGALVLFLISKQLLLTADRA